MVPSKISLSNFMCYKNASLDLTGVHLACLSGDNGAGKSALLDAMTWALWGQARADSDDDLIAQGEILMQADFEFYVGEQLYRVDRKRTKKAGGKTALEFFIRNGQQWTPITGGVIRATQKQITDVLHMSYETFINSAFLKQGRADEFTVRTPAQRKQVLAEILGLGDYDELQKKAKETVKEAEDKIKVLKGKLEEIEQEVAKRPRYEAQKAEAEFQLQECNERLVGHRGTLQELSSRESRLNDKEREQIQATEQLNRAQEQLRKLEQDQARSRVERAESQKMLARRAEIEKGYGDLEKIKEELEVFNFKAERNLELERSNMRLEGVINRERTKLEGEINLTRTKMEEMRKLSAELGKLETQVANLHKDLAFSISASEDLAQKQNEAQAREAEIKVAEGEYKRLTKELEEIKVKADRVPQPGDVCDHCGTLLTEEARQTTLTQYREEYRLKQKEQKETQKRAEILKTERDELRREAKELEKPARDRSILEKQAGSLEEKLAQARKADSDLVGQQALLETYTESLNNKQYALNDQRKLDEIQGEIKALGYDKKAHDQIRERQRELKLYEDQMVKLREAGKDFERAEKDLGRYAEMEQDLRDKSAEYEDKLKRLQQETAGLKQLRERIEAEKGSVKEAEGQQKLLMRNQAEAESAIERCNVLEIQKKEQHKEYTKAGEAKSVYSDLAEAFGKKGLQALVIDTVLPELEEETNRLLGDMSDGRMSVRFDTQRDSKKGETIETLDLRISDEQGSRPYELFSGGEAFRVNFAVRVALSKLLARRSGAQLRTLIIDEGFGSQDGQGRDRLVEAIRGIENDFERVLVITHLQELKDVFPVRIDVVKTASGSQLAVN